MRSRSKWVLILTTFLASVAYGSQSQIWGVSRLENILGYGKEGSSHLGEIFTLLQSEYFAKIFLIALIAVPSLFALHYMVIGSMRFSEKGKKIFTFSIFNRIIHWVAAIAFLILVPTGFIMIFGSNFGGGEFVRFCRHLHGIGTIMFAIVVLPMFFMWVSRMFIALDDIKWLFVFGGYLSKKKRPIPAGKFNAGQKAWFWLSTLGGIVMILTGAMMYFLDFNSTSIQNLAGLSHIDMLRAAAIIHNVLGVVVVMLFFVHMYMSIFAIKGAIGSMITGYKHEEEVQIMHSSWYKELQRKKRYSVFCKS